MPGAPLKYQEDRLAFSMSMKPTIYQGGLTVNTRDVPGAAACLIATLETAMANGCYVIAATMKPVEQGVSYDDANYRANHLPNNATLRAWAEAQGPAKVLLIDWSVLMDPGLTGYCIVPGLLYDKIHPFDYGASVLSDLFNSKLDLITKTDPVSDLFEWRWNNLQNHLANPTFNSSDAALPLFSRTGVWASGSVGPRGSRGSGVGAPASTVVTTLEPNPETGGNSIVFPIVTTAGSIAGEGFLFQPRPNATYSNGFVPAPQLAGKYVVFALEIEVPAGAYFATPTASIADDFANTTKASRVISVASADIGLNNRRRSKAQRFKLMTDPCFLDPASGGPRRGAAVKVLGADAFAAGVTALNGAKIRRAAIWDVGNPKSKYNLA